MEDGRGLAYEERCARGDSVGRVTRRSILALAVASCLTILAACSGSDAGTWFVPKTPKLDVSVSAGCPRYDTAVADVVNTFRGPPLAPPNPASGMICRYSGRLGSGQPRSGLLLRPTVLDHDQATRLDVVIRQLNLTKPSGVFHCPSDVGIATVIGFSYPDRADVGLWYQTSGCQAIDNGRLGAFQGANPSFGAFQSVIDLLSPPFSY